MKKIDLRIIKTKRNLYEALLSLMKDKEFEDIKVNDICIKTQKLLYETLLKLMKNNSFEEIKVSDICNKALINRSTFYSHYEDKYELFTDLIDYFKNELKEELYKNNNIKNIKEYYIELINLFLTYIEKRQNEFLSIIINNRNSIIIDILYDTISEEVNKHIKEYNKIYFKNIPNELSSKFYLGGVVSVSINWLKNINKYSKEDIINYLTKLIPNEE